MKKWEIKAVLLIVLMIAIANTKLFRVNAQKPNLNEMKEALYYSGAAYCDPRLIKSSECKKCKRSETIEVIESKRTGTLAFVAIDNFNKLLIISFRGTENTRGFRTSFNNWVTNLRVKRVRYSKIRGASVHRGFYRAYRSIKSNLQRVVTSLYRDVPDYEILITGHSLGGALATICAVDMFITNKQMQDVPFQLYTFGAPRVGNKAFARAITENAYAWRVVNGNDPVPGVPPRKFGYRHFGPVMRFSALGKGNKPIVCRDAESRKCRGNKFLKNPLDHIWVYRDSTDCNFKRRKLNPVVRLLNKAEKAAKRAKRQARRLKRKINRLAKKEKRIKKRVKQRKRKAKRFLRRVKRRFGRFF